MREFAVAAQMTALNVLHQSKRVSHVDIVWASSKQRLLGLSQ